MGVPSPSCSALPRNSSLYSRMTLRHRSKSGEPGAGSTDAGWNTPVGTTLSMPPATATLVGSRRSRMKVFPARLRRIVSVRVDAQEPVAEAVLEQPRPREVAHGPVVAVVVPPLFYQRSQRAGLGMPTIDGGRRNVVPPPKLHLGEIERTPNAPLRWRKQ